LEALYAMETDVVVIMSLAELITAVSNMAADAHSSMNLNLAASGFGAIGTILRERATAIDERAHVLREQLQATHRDAGDAGGR
jgi:hypothetical protein